MPDDPRLNRGEPFAGALLVGQQKADRAFQSRILGGRLEVERMQQPEQGSIAKILEDGTYEAITKGYFASSIYGG